MYAWRWGWLWATAVMSPWVGAGDWTMYRGSNGDGVCPERIQLDWPATGPRKLWAVPLTNGLSSVTVSAGRLFTQVRRGNTEYAVALNADTGKFLWTQPVWTQASTLYPDGGVGGDDGPRSTPVVAGDRVIVLSSYLSLHCLEAATGAPVWSRDLRAELGGSLIDWQNAASPVLVNDLVLLNANAPGGRLVALRSRDGSVAWQRHDYALTHATPVRATIQGVDQVIFFTQFGLVAVAPADGAELWRYAFSFSISTAASPVVEGNTVFCSAAYNRGAAAVEIGLKDGQLTVTELWKSPTRIRNHWGTSVARAGHIYGVHDGSGSPLKCIDLRTGAEKWRADGFGFGATLVVNDQILAVTEGGEVMIVEPDPGQYRERSRFRAVTGRIWNSPAISNGRLYVRGTTELAAFDVSLPAPMPLQLRATLPGADGKLRLTIRGTDGQPVAPERADHLEVLAAATADSPLAEWARLSAPLVAQDGGLHIDLPMDAHEGQQFFQVRETP